MPATLFVKIVSSQRRALLTMGLALVVLSVSGAPLPSQNKPRPAVPAPRPVPPPHVHPQFNPQMHQMHHAMMLQLQQQAAIRNAFIQRHAAIHNQHVTQPQPAATTKLATVKNQPLAHTTNPLVQKKPASAVALASQRQQTNPQAKANWKLRQRDLSFALSHLGWPTAMMGRWPSSANFVNAALRASGEQGSGSYTALSKQRGSAVWGQTVAHIVPGTAPAAFSSIKPGDVLQINNVSTHRANSNTFGPTGWYYPRQSAIVYKNLGNGRLVLLEQGGFDHQYVSYETINLAKMSGGSVWAYQPQAARSTFAGPTVTAAAYAPAWSGYARPAWSAPAVASSSGWAAPAMAWSSGWAGPNAYFSPGWFGYRWRAPNPYFFGPFAYGWRPWL